MTSFDAPTPPRAPGGSPPVIVVMGVSGCGKSTVATLLAQALGLPYLEAAEILGVTRNTIAGHVKSIYAKLEVSSRGEAVYEALSQGIVSLDSKD